MGSSLSGARRLVVVVEWVVAERVVAGGAEFTAGAAAGAAGAVGGRTVDMD